jgi:hypothetical protein
MPSAENDAPRFGRCSECPKVIRLTGNYGQPLYGQTHDDVAENCGPLLAEVVREHLAEARVLPPGSGDGS